MREQFKADKLQLEFIGKEKTYFDHYETNLEKGHGENKGRSIIIQKTILLKVFEGRIVMPGVYEFPFTIDLPINLPSSMVYCGPKRSMMRIRYSVRSAIEDISGTYKPIYDKKFVEISQAPPHLNFNVPRQGQHDIKTLFLLDRGYCRAECIFEKDVYQPNDIINVRCKVINEKCKDSVSKITLKLKRFVIATTVKNASDNK